MIPLILKKEQRDKDNDKSQYHKRKQISRILKHLTSQLYEKQKATPKKSPLPSDILIDRWVHSSLRHHHIDDNNDWQKVIYSTLKAIYFQLHQSTLELDKDIQKSHVDHFLLQLLLLTDRKEMYFR